MGGGNGNKTNLKGSDAEDMCSAGSLESDPRYDTCCSNVCSPGKVVRDMIVGLLVIVGIVVVVSGIFAICFFLVPESKDEEKIKIFESGDAEGVIGGPPPTEHNQGMEVKPSDNDRYDVSPSLAKIEEETAIHDHSGHNHDHSGHKHDHPGHEHDQTHHMNDHTGHGHDHSTHSHDMAKPEPEPEPEHIDEQAEHHREPNHPPSTTTRQEIEVPVSTSRAPVPETTSTSKAPMTTTRFVPSVEEELPVDQIATASAGHRPMNLQEEVIKETPEVVEFTPKDGIFSFLSTTPPKITETTMKDSSPLFSILGSRQTSERPRPTEAATTRTPIVVNSVPAQDTTIFQTTTTKIINTPPPVAVTNAPVTGVCLPRQLPQCATIAPWTHTSFPNWVNDTTSDQVVSTLQYFQDIVVNSRCSPRALEFSCAVLEPPCNPEGAPIPPCKSFCRSVSSTCSEFLIKNLNQNIAFDCDRYPDSSDPAICVDLPQGTCLGAEYPCGTGRCISKRLVCDGVRDCPNGSDESSCPGTGQATTETFPTTEELASLTEKTTSERTPPTTSERTPSTTSERVTSTTSERIPSTTSSTTTAHTTPETWDMPFTFPNTPPVTEVDTTTLPAEPETEIPQSCPQLQCLDGKCITILQLNDGVNDCSDGSDEQDFSDVLKDLR